MATDQIAQARIDGAIKTAAAEVLGKMGLGISDAIRILLTRIAQDGALPFDMRALSDAVLSAPNLRFRDGAATVLDPRGFNLDNGAILELVMALDDIQRLVDGFRSMYWLPNNADQFEMAAELHKAFQALVLRCMATVMPSNPAAYFDARVIGFAFEREDVVRGDDWECVPAMAGFDLGERQWSKSRGSSAINPTMSISACINKREDRSTPNDMEVSFGMGDDQALAAFCAAAEDNAKWLDTLCAAGGLTPFTPNVLKGVSEKTERTPSLYLKAFNEQFVRPSIEGTLRDSCEGFTLVYSTANSRDVWPAMLAATAVTLFADAAIHHDPGALYRAMGYGNSVLNAISHYRKLIPAGRNKTQKAA